MELAVFIVISLVLAILFYFLPTFISYVRHTNHRGAILWVNLLFGWTVLGWIAVAAWALVEESEHGSDTERSRAPGKLDAS
jgi:hypothetical protein